MTCPEATNAREHNEQRDPDGDCQAEKRYPDTLRALIWSRVGRSLSNLSAQRSR